MLAVALISQRLAEVLTLSKGAISFQQSAFSCVEEIRQTEWRAVADIRPSLGGRQAAPASQVQVIQILG